MNQFVFTTEARFVFQLFYKDGLYRVNAWGEMLSFSGK